MVQEKRGVECDCGDNKAPEDMTKIASDRTVTCGHCGQEWTGLKNPEESA